MAFFGTSGYLLIPFVAAHLFKEREAWTHATTSPSPELYNTISSHRSSHLLYSLRFFPSFMHGKSVLRALQAAIPKGHALLARSSLMLYFFDKSLVSCFLDHEVCVT